MGRLVEFKYRQITKKLKQFGFAFERQAAGSHEIWYNVKTDRDTTIPNHLGDMSKGTLRVILKQAAGLDRKAVLASHLWRYL